MRSFLLAPRRIAPGVACLSILVLSGCGGDGLKRVPIMGTITANGAPVAGAVVQLLPGEGTSGEGAIGTSGPDGKFEVISSRQSDAGVPPGEYIVRASRLVMPDGSPLPPDAADADYPEARESIPQPYSGADSPLKVVISEAGGDVKVDIPDALVDPKNPQKPRKRAASEARAP